MPNEDEPEAASELVDAKSEELSDLRGETYTDKVKLTFSKGASLEDPTGLFNASLVGNTRRAIDLQEGDELDEEAFKALVRDAAALNKS